MTLHKCAWFEGPRANWQEKCRSLTADRNSCLRNIHCCFYKVGPQPSYPEFSESHPTGRGVFRGGGIQKLGCTSLNQSILIDWIPQRLEGGCLSCMDGFPGLALHRISVLTTKHNSKGQNTDRDQVQAPKFYSASAGLSKSLCFILREFSSARRLTFGWD